MSSEANVPATTATATSAHQSPIQPRQWRQFTLKFRHTPAAATSNGTPNGTSNVVSGAFIVNAPTVKMARDTLFQTYRDGNLALCQLQAKAKITVHSKIQVQIRESDATSNLEWSAPLSLTQAFAQGFLESTCSDVVVVCSV